MYLVETEESHMTIPSQPLRQIALLIDGDNAQPSLLERMLEEAAKYGILTVRRIYGDWTESNMKGWKEALQDHAIQPVQQFRYTTGKNATDSALIIDAMDVMHSGAVGGFCLVSSDSDYTRLATRIREQGFFVMGIGRSNTPKAFVNACEVFVHTENLADKDEGVETTPAARRAGRKQGGAPKALIQAAEMAAADDGWASLGAVGTRLRQLDSSFDPRSYGHRQLSQLVRAYPDAFEVREDRTDAGRSDIYVRIKA